LLGQKLSRNKFLRELVNALYSRNDFELKRGNFRVKGDTIDVFPAYMDWAFRIIFGVMRLKHWNQLIRLPEKS